jgi:hypothetical protein
LFKICYIFLADLNFFYLFYKLIFVALFIVFFSSI